MLLANGFAPAGALNGFAPPPPPPPPNGFAPPEVGADVLNGLTAFELPKGLGLVVVLPVEGANGLGALAPPPPDPLLPPLTLGCRWQVIKDFGGVQNLRSWCDHNSTCVG